MKKQRKSNRKIELNRKVHPNSLANLKRGGPGRPRGSKNHDGIGAVLTMLKNLVAREDNIAKIENGLQLALNKNPVGFYYRFVMPLFPKSIDHTGFIESSVKVFVTKLKAKHGDNSQGTR